MRSIKLKGRPPRTWQKNILFCWNYFEYFISINQKFKKMFSTRHSVLVIRSFFFEIARHILNDTFVHTFTPTTTATMSTIQCDQIVFGYNYSVKCSRNIWQLSGLLQKTVPFCQLLKIWAIFNSNIWSHWSTWIIAANTFHTAILKGLKGCELAHLQRPECIFMTLNFDHF